MTTPTQEPQDPPWLRLENESAAAFHAFEHYRDLLAPDRSIDAAYAAHLKHCLGRELTGKTRAKNWHKWSSAHNWVKRALAHDADLAQRRRERRAVQLEDARDDIALVSRHLLQRVARRLNSLPPDQEIPLNLLAQWVKTGGDSYLKALGFEEKVAISGPDGGPVQVSQTTHVPDPATWAEILAIREQIGDTVELEDGDPGTD